MSVSSTAKYVLLTGSTGSIGKQIAIGVARHPVHLILTVRDVKRGSNLRDEISKITGNKNIYVEQVDLSSKASITAFTSSYLDKYPSLSVLINNAATTAESRTETAEGIETMFATNVLSYFLFMNQLRPALIKGAPSRIVNVASNYAGGLNIDDLQFKNRRYDGNDAYRQSKQANRMNTHYASKLFKSDNITVNAMHPGVVTSNLLKGLGMSSGFNSAEDAASTAVYLATSPEVEGKTGGFYQDSKLKTDSFEKDTTTSEKLWKYLSSL